MKIAVISPTDGLRRFSVLGDIELALPHIVLSDDSYASYFKERSQEGVYVILDNGAFELKKPMAISDVLEAASIIGAKELICSDVFNDGAATVEATKEFSSRVPSDYYLQAVPQGNTPEEWFECAGQLSNIPNVTCLGLSKLGVHHCFKGKDIGESRLKCLDDSRWSRVSDEAASLHLLGGHFDILHELRRYRGVGSYRLACQHAGFRIRSNDSSAAVWFGHYGQCFDQTTPVLDPGPVDFRKKIHNDEIILRNIALWHKASKEV